MPAHSQGLRLTQQEVLEMSGFGEIDPDQLMDELDDAEEEDELENNAMVAGQSGLFMDQTIPMAETLHGAGNFNFDLDGGIFGGSDQGGPQDAPGTESQTIEGIGSPLLESKTKSPEDEGEEMEEDGFDPTQQTKKVSIRTNQRAQVRAVDPSLQHFSKIRYRSSVYVFNYGYQGRTKEQVS